MSLVYSTLTDNGSVSMESGKTYAVGTMASFKDSYIDSNTHLQADGTMVKLNWRAQLLTYSKQSNLTSIKLKF